MLLSRLAEHGLVFALAFWWQISASLHRMRDACRPLGSDMTCPDGGALMLSNSDL